MAQALTDSELVARCRAGDEQAWAELVDRFSRYVYAISVQAFRLPESDAEDVFQEVFARAYQHLDALRQGVVGGGCVRRVGRLEGRWHSRRGTVA